MLTAKPKFNPIDLNLTFLTHAGWMQATDHLRFHLPPSDDLHATGKMAEMLRSVEPHILVCKPDDEEDRFITI